MTSRNRIALLLGAFLLMALAAPRAQARGLDLTDRLEAYVEETARRVKETDDPARKRAILNESFTNLTSTLHRIERLPGLSEQNKAVVAALQADVRTQHNRLNGLGDYQRVPDAQLNQFSDSVQQALNLQNRTVTLSLTTALLILVILILVL